MLQLGLIFSHWMSFRKGTELKARASIYHLERLEDLNAEYLRVQPLPEAQSVGNLHHPLKEALFFEFHAVITNLSSCIDSLLQEINCACDLKLSPIRVKGKQSVSLGTVLDCLRSRQATTPAFKDLLILEDLKTEPWSLLLRGIRDKGIHADLYGDSSETRFIGKILAKIDEIRSYDRPQNPGDLGEALKRDVVVHFDNEDFPMIELAQWMTSVTLDYTKNIHDILLTVAKKRRRPRG